LHIGQEFHCLGSNDQISNEKGQIWQLAFNMISEKTSNFKQNQSSKPQLYQTLYKKSRNILDIKISDEKIYKFWSLFSLCENVKII
jgi:hypothetical protein